MKTEGTVPAASLRHVVVPVDATDESSRAVALARRLAAGLEIPVTVVSVIDDFRLDATTRVETLQRTLADVPGEVERKLVQARSPAHAIAEESHDGVVVMATSATTFDEEGVRGSVAEFVITAATSPVILLGPHCPEDVRVQRIVVGVDPSHDQTGLSSWATRLGYQLGIPVEFVHVDTDGADLGSKVRRLRLDGAESVAHRLRAETTDGLLALGSHGHVGLARLTKGSVGAAVIADATHPVMILGPNAVP